MDPLSTSDLFQQFLRQRRYLNNVTPATIEWYEIGLSLCEVEIMASRFFELNRDEIAELDRPVNGVGGFENFLRRLQKQVNHATGEIKLTEKDLADIPHYAFDFKQGGWESRLVNTFGRVLGPQLGREESH